MSKRKHESFRHITSSRSKPEVSPSPNLSEIKQLTSTNLNKYMKNLKSKGLLSHNAPKGSNLSVKKRYVSFVTFSCHEWILTIQSKLGCGINNILHVILKGNLLPWADVMIYIVTAFISIIIHALESEWWSITMLDKQFDHSSQCR